MDKNGYVYLAESVVKELYPLAILRPNQIKHGALEHVVVMSQHMQREIKKGETIHHKDGNRSNNDISNLELRRNHHGQGQSIEDMLVWATKILHQYAPERLTAPWQQAQTIQNELDVL